MKAKLSALLVVVGLLAGCVVDSEQPFYRTDDLFFNGRLLGEWRDAGKPGEAPGESFRIERDGAKGYVVREAKAEGSQEVIELRLFKLDGQTFGDYYERPAKGSPARHQLMKIDEIADKWTFRGLNYGWMKEHLRANPKALAHRFDESGKKDNPPVTLTATTAQLQAFVLKHQSETGFFGEPTVFVRVNAAPGKAAR